MESRFFEPSVSRTSRYLEPNLVSLGFALLKLYNFTPDFSNPRLLGTPDNSNQFLLSWDKLPLDHSNLRKFPDHLVRMSITFTLLNKLGTPIIFAKVPGTFLKSEPRDSRLHWQRGNTSSLQLNWVSAIYRLYTTCVLLCSVFVFISKFCL